MSKELSEEDMRLALFGPSKAAPSQVVPVKPDKPASGFRSSPTAKPLSPKLRVTLRVTKEFEGAVEMFIYDANTLSTLLAEQEAKSEAKKNRFKYFNVVSVHPLQQ